jgi:tetratricopeptide (TPR) repeat protein
MSADFRFNVAALLLSLAGIAWGLWKTTKISRTDPNHRKQRAQWGLTAFAAAGAAGAIGIALVAGAESRRDNPNLPRLPVFDTVGTRRIVDSAQSHDSLTSLSVDAQRGRDSVDQQAQRRQGSTDSLVVGIRYAARGRLTDAISRYNSALRIDKGNATAYGYKGYAQYRLRNYDSALVTMRRGIAIDSTDPWAYYNYSLPLWAVGDTAESLAALERAIELNPSFRDLIKQDVQFNRMKKSKHFQELVATELP